MKFDIGPYTATLVPFKGDDYLRIGERPTIDTSDFAAHHCEVYLSRDEARTLAASIMAWLKVPENRTHLPIPLKVKG